MESTKRNGELHPFLTKIEGKFYPLKNKLNRKELFKGHLLVFGVMIVFAIIYGLCIGIFQFFGFGFGADSPLLLQFSTIIPAFIFARGEYYRFQDLNLAGNISYKINIAFWTVGLLSIFIKSDILSNVILCLAAVYLLSIILIPGSKGGTPVQQTI